MISGNNTIAKTTFRVLLPSRYNISLRSRYITPPRPLSPTQWFNLLGALRGCAGRAPEVTGSPGDCARVGVVGAVAIACVAGEAGVVGAVVIAGIAGEAGRCLGGRLRRGGAAGVVSVVPV